MGRMRITVWSSVSGIFITSYLLAEALLQFFGSNCTRNFLRPKRLGKIWFQLWCLVKDK